MKKDRHKHCVCKHVSLHVHVCICIACRFILNSQILLNILNIFAVIYKNFLIGTWHLPSASGIEDRGCKTIVYLD